MINTITTILCLTFNSLNRTTAQKLQTTKINVLLPLYNVQYEKNTDLSGCPIKKKYGFRLYNTGKIMYGHIS